MILSSMLLRSQGMHIVCSAAPPVAISALAAVLALTVLFDDKAAVAEATARARAAETEM